MKRVQSIIVIAVILGAGAIVWFKGFQSGEGLAAPSPQDAVKQNSEEGTSTSKDDDAKTKTDDKTETKEESPSKPEPKADEPEKPSPEAEAEPAKQEEDNAEKQEADSAHESKEDSTEEPEEAEPEDPNNPMESLNLKDVEMKNLVSKIGEWTGKVIIPVDDALKQKITVYAPEELPRKEALYLIYSALRIKGYVAEETDRIIYFKPIDQAKLGQVPTIPDDQPLATIENKEQIVQRFIRLAHSEAERMSEILKSFVGEHGEIRPDASTATLLVIDTVSNLVRIERVVQEFDVPEAEETTSEIFTIKQADPIEIVQMLRILLGDSSLTGSNNRYRSRYSTQSTAATFRGPNNSTIALVPVDKFKWIIARAAPQDLKTIRDYIERLDQSEEAKSEYETVSIRYADPSEVANRIQESIASMPGSELKPSVVVSALSQSRQVMIFGRQDMREMVKRLIEEIDLPTGEFETKVFDLKFVEADQIKENLDSLYGQEGPPQYDSYYYYRYGPGSRGSDSSTVKVIAFPMMQQVTVIASPENMRKIEEQIKEWDHPLDVDKVKPQILTLRNSDPVQMADLLSRLFSEDQESSSSRIIRLLLSDGSGNDKKKIIGPLYGQLTFEEVPGTKKILVISKIPEAYAVIRALVEELDSQEMAEIPKVITIKYADPEVLAERLNALFNERGSNATFRRGERGLSSDYSIGTTDSDDDNNNSNRNNDNNQANYTPWWNSGRADADQEPLSNIIGRVRFIPDNHSRSIMVLSPPEFYESIEGMIKQLDVPGKQVLVKAVIIEVDHSSMTSLGVQLATDSASFGDLSENSLMALGNLTHLATHGSAAVDSTSTIGASGSGSLLGGGVDIYALIDFLQKTVHARILNQQSLWTKDNTEANFFKGDTVAFQTEASVTGTGIQSSSLERMPVGMTLRVSPSITPEQRVDMEINVMLSQLTTELVNDQPVTSDMKTTTHMIVKDAQTIMLGGILFQRDEQIERKLPLLGDLPLLGQLFRHNYKNVANSELIIFITPYVMTEEGGMEAEMTQVMADPLQKLNDVSTHLDQVVHDLVTTDPNESL